MTLDELVVELKLDGTGFTDGQRKALAEFKKTDDEFTKRLKGLEATTKNTGFAFGDMTSAAEGLFSVVAGAGLAAFAKDVTASAAATGRMATNIGVATRELSAFGMVIERNGGSAESAAASLKNYADTIQNWKWGKGSPDFLMGLNQIGGASLDASPMEIVEKLAKFAESHTAQETNQVGARLGMSQDIINSIIHGLQRFRQEYAETYKLALDPSQTKKLTEAQSAWVGLGQAIKGVGTDVVSNAEGPFSKIASAISAWIGENRKLADSLGAVLAVLTAIGSASGIGKLLSIIGVRTKLSGLAKAGTRIGAAAALPSRLVKGGGIGGMALGVAETMKYDSQHGNELRTMLRNALGIDDPGEAAPWAGAQPNTSGGRDSPAIREARIRAFAKMFGINPDIAMKVSPAEGFNNYVGDGGTSFGDFQLHVTPGGRGNAVGDQFKKRTGLDPSDPRNEGAMDWFALQDIARNGWHAYHGAARVGIGDREGIGEVNIGSIVVNTDSKNPREHGRLTAEALKNSLAKQLANNANSGQTHQ